MQGSSESVDWTAWSRQLTTLERMLQLRGYSSISNIMHGTDPLLVCSAKDAQGDMVLVYFVTENKVGVRTLRNLQCECEASGCRHVILVTEDGLTPFAQKVLDDPEKKTAGSTVVEIFKRRELSFCILDHNLVPRHSLLTAAERRALLQKLGCKASCMPRLKESDPVARFMNFPVGGIVRIQRNIGSSQEEYYRLVTA
jgi:DNA-directed RNA polymerase subunit H